MKCPFCGNEETQVKDSRPSEDNSVIRRRRECPECDARFTTFERIQLRDLTVIKNDGRRELFQRDKLLRSLHLCMQKRPVEADALEQCVSDIVRKLELSGETDITSKEIGRLTMEKVAALDLVAYVRYASVYKDFKEVHDFKTFLEDLENIYNNKKTKNEH